MTSPAWIIGFEADADLQVLSRLEVFWRDHFTWFKEQGYQLRPRYAPDWIPSWKGTKKFLMECEDGYHPLYSQINDALHIATGLRVGLKKISKEDHPFEEDIIHYLSSELLSKDPRNHCAPLLDVLHPPVKDGDKAIQVLVMPYLRPFDAPIFDTFGEAIECIRQLFEGLQFMHENHVAHRDVKSNNFMMESEKICPGGFHHFVMDNKPDLSGAAKFYTRTQRPSKYFVIDFGMSRRYEPGDDPVEPTIFPDGKTQGLQNPFQVDVYLAGDLVRETFLDGNPMLPDSRGYRGFEFLRPLINDMVLNDPTQRPKMDEVNKRFQDIANGLSSSKLRSRTSCRSSTIIQEVGHIFSHWTRKMFFVIRRTPPVPRV